MSDETHRISDQRRNEKEVLIKTFGLELVSPNFVT